MPFLVQIRLFTKEIKVKKGVENCVFMGRKRCYDKEILFPYEISTSSYHTMVLSLETVLVST